MPVRPFVFPFECAPKPRMVKSDSWAHRPCVDKYWQFKNKLVSHANKIGFVYVNGMSIRFEMAMPDSWSKKKKNKFEGKPHLVKPDMDNMLKSLQDCLLTNDSGIWWYERLQKVWAREGRIIIEKLC